MRTVALASLLLLVAGCATAGKYRAILDSWAGQPVQNLVNSWGYPTSQMTAPDGNTVYVYQRSGSIVMPTTSTTNATVNSYGSAAYGTATTTTYGGGIVQLNCATYFEIGSDKTIVNWRTQGNNCVSR